MKLGQVKTGQGDYLKCSNPDSLSYLLSGCLTHSLSFLWHQGSSWTTAYMSPQWTSRDQVTSTSHSYIENFNKDKVPTCVRTQYSVANPGGHLPSTVTVTVTGKSRSRVRVVTSNQHWHRSGRQARAGGPACGHLKGSLVLELTRDSDLLPLNLT